MTKIRILVALAVAGVLLGAAGLAPAQTDFYYPDGTYIVDTPMIGNTAFVGKDSNMLTSDPNTGDPYVASVTITASGSLPGTSVSGTSSVILSGGDLYGGLDTFDNSSATINSGTIEVECVALGSSSIMINGGTLANGAQATGSGTVTLNGGLLQASAQASQSGTLNVTGGTMTYVGGAGSSNVTVSGGIFTDIVDPYQFFDVTTGAFTLEGAGLTATNLGHNNQGEEYLLSGTLSDGDSVTGDTAEVFTGAAGITLINAVPEPASLAILSVGALVLAPVAGDERLRRVRDEVLPPEQDPP